MSENKQKYDTLKNISIISENYVKFMRELCFNFHPFFYLFIYF